MANYYSNSRADAFSIGPTGPRGPTGPTGATGPTGPTGPAGTNAQPAALFHVASAPDAVFAANTPGVMTICKWDNTANKANLFTAQPGLTLNFTLTGSVGFLTPRMTFFLAASPFTSPDSTFSKQQVGPFSYSGSLPVILDISAWGSATPDALYLSVELLDVGSTGTSFTNFTFGLVNSLFLAQPQPNPVPYFLGQTATVIDNT